MLWSTHVVKAREQRIRSYPYPRERLGIVGGIFSSIGLRTPDRRGPEYQEEEEEEEEGGVVSHGGRLEQ